MAQTPSNTPGRPYVIVAALAFDETGPHALDEAARVADRGSRTELHVVHVTTGNDLIALREGPDGESLALRQVKLELQRRVEAMWGSNSRQVIAHIRVGNPAQAVLQTAADVGADLIVVGSNQRRGLERLVLGSVSLRVLEEARCPVLVALPRDYAALAASESIQPPCDDCAKVRAETDNKTYWCERHTRTRLAPHVYEPSDRRRNSIMPAM